MEKNEFTHVKIKETRVIMDTLKQITREFTMSNKDWEKFQKTIHPKTLKFEVISRFSDRKVSDEAMYEKLKISYNTIKETAPASEVLGELNKMYSIKKEGWVANAIKVYENKMQAEKEHSILVEKVTLAINEAERFESESNLPKALEKYEEAYAMDPKNDLVSNRIDLIRSSLDSNKK